MHSGGLFGQSKEACDREPCAGIGQDFHPVVPSGYHQLIVAFAINAQAAFENRTLLIWFDVLLAFVLALTLYSMSSKATGATWGIWDILSLALILSAVLLDAIALSGIVFRLSNYGFTPNKSAALGENVLLLVNLTLLAIGYVRYLTGRQPFQKIVEMQWVS
jgi:hypothetical protein